MKIRLAVYQEKDTEAMVKLLLNEEIKKSYMIPDFDTMEKAIQFAKKLIATAKSNQVYERGIYLEEQLIGWINEVEKEDDYIELGYVVDPAYQNHGYATQALTLAIKEQFEKGIRKVITGAFEWNHGSIRVMEKCRMSRIEKTEEITYHNELHHCIYYQIEQ